MMKEHIIGKCPWCEQDMTEKQDVVYTYAGHNLVEGGFIKKYYHTKCAVKVLEIIIQDMEKEIEILNYHFVTKGEIK